MYFEYLIVLIIGSYLLLLVAYFIRIIYMRKENRNIRDITINKLSLINKLYIKLERETNEREKRFLSGEIFDLYKEILLLIDNVRNEMVIKSIIEDELFYCYNNYYKYYVNTFSNEERYSIITHYVSKWKRGQIQITYENNRFV